MTRILPTTRTQKRAIQEEKEKNHHIPDILIDEASNLACFQHRQELRRFAEEYKDLRFKSLEEEYESVKISISNLMDHFFPSSLSDIIERGMRATLAAGRIEENYREHFIHPFQVFLLGSVIMDKFYDNFQQWYDPELAQSTETCLESAWLLTTIFHDRGKDFTILQRALELETGGSSDRAPDEDAYMRLLSSFYFHRSRGNPLNTWNMSAAEYPVLTSIFDDYSRRWSHGIKGSIFMLRNICKKPEMVTPRDVASAFAIAVHDAELWGKLHLEKILPLRINLWPLPSLLLYLDTIQEWSRQPTVETDVRLLKLTSTERSVNLELAFDSPHAAKTKLEECAKAQQCIISEDLELCLSVKVRLNR